MWANFVIFKKLPKANICPLDENSPNLVTLSKTKNGKKKEDERERVAKRRRENETSGAESTNVNQLRIPSTFYVRKWSIVDGK
jgi:hypothetical protein